MREEARAVSEDERLKRLNELKTKREELDFGVKGDSLKTSPPNCFLGCHATVLRDIPKNGCGGD